MPIYEFVCHDCGTNFEKRVSFTHITTPSCNSCESNNVQRRMSTPAIHFKGSGWYVTDSKKSNSASSSTKSETSESSKATPSTAEPVAA